MIVEVRNRQRARRVNAAQLKKLAGALNSKLSSLSIVLVSDRQIAELNLRHHSTLGPTDILTFDYGDGAGELIISVDHAMSQARRYRTTPARELALYLVHGILHLRGYDDRTPIQRRRMRAAERRLLARIAARFDLANLLHASRQGKA
jgi:probable rRNA maturation factor